MTSDKIILRVKGQDIIAAIKKLADKPVVRRDYFDGRDVFVVGQVSNFAWANLVITVIDGHYIEPDKTYEYIKISEYRRNDGSFSARNNRKAVINAVKEFAIALRNELEKSISPLKPDEMPVLFEFDGVSYQCPQSAYNKDKIILPDGRILKVGGWLEKNPPAPVNLSVFDELPMATVA